MDGRALGENLGQQAAIHDALEVRQSRCWYPVLWETSSDSTREQKCGATFRTLGTD